MSARVYVLLDVAQGELAKVMRTLRDKPGVIMADIVEGPPDIVMVVEARQRRRLAELTVEALSSIEGMTENLQLLPVTANSSSHGHITTVRANRNRGKMVNSGTRVQGENTRKAGRHLLGSTIAAREEKTSEVRDGAKDE